MSERFEQEIQNWYNHSPTADLKYTLFEQEKPEPKVSDLVNNIGCVYSCLNLFSRVALKNFKNILEKQKDLESKVLNCQEKLEICENLIRKTQSETRKSLDQVSTEIQQTKPLTKREIVNLVQEIAEQPKPTEDLRQKVQRIEDLLHEVKTLITG